MWLYPGESKTGTELVYASPPSFSQAEIRNGVVSCLPGFNRAARTLLSRPSVNNSRPRFTLPSSWTLIRGIRGGSVLIKWRYSARSSARFESGVHRARRFRFVDRFDVLGRWSVDANRDVGAAVFSGPFCAIIFAFFTAGCAFWVESYFGSPVCGHVRNQVTTHWVIKEEWELLSIHGRLRVEFMGSRVRTAPELLSRVGALPLTNTGFPPSHATSWPCLGYRARF